MENQKLAELAQQGDKEAFTRLIKNCENTMYRVSKSILKYDDDCADAIQETILKAYISINTLKNPRFFKTWLIRILINECNRIYKARKKVIPLVKWPEPSQTEQVENHPRLEEAIQSLDEDFRIVVTLFYLEDFSIKEISELLHISEGTIKSRLNRARAKLAQFLKGQNERSVSDGKKLFYMEMKDLLLKSELGSAPPESIMLRIDETLATLPDKDRNITKSKTKGKRWFIIGAILAGIAGTAAFSAVTNTEQNIESIAETHPYVVIDDHFYKATGELVDKDKIGIPMMEVQRGSGELNLLKDGDSEYFNVGESIYKLIGTDSNEEYAIKHIAGGTKFIPVYKYFILKRSEEVANPDPKTILATKNDAKEIDIVMKNIRRLDSHFYEFKNMGSRVIVQSADYHPQYRKGYKNGTNITYRVPEGDEGDLQKYIYVREYRVDKKDEVYSVVFMSNISSQLKVRKEFDLNGLHWKYYGPELYLGEKDGYYYEVNSQQGKVFSEDKMMEFIKNFQSE